MDCTKITMNFIDNVTKYVHKNKNEITKDDCDNWLNKFYYTAIRKFYGNEIMDIQRERK